MTAVQAQMKPKTCVCCQRPMPGFDGKEICRWYGKTPSQALAEDCTQFVQRVWYVGAWVCDSDCRVNG